MTPQQAYILLADDIENWVLWKALADVFEELGETGFSMGVRWMADHQKSPHFREHGPLGSPWKNGYVWYLESQLIREEVPPRSVLPASFHFAAYNRKTASTLPTAVLDLTLAYMNVLFPIGIPFSMFPNALMNPTGKMITEKAKKP